MADRPETAPWTIKSVSISAREKAGRYAKKAGMTMGEWLPLAIDAQADRQDGTSVFPPGTPGSDSGNLVVPTVALSDIAATIQAMAAASQAGLKISGGAVRDTMAVVRQHMAVSRGLPWRNPIRKKRQTVEHMTLDGDDAEVVP